MTQKKKGNVKDLDGIVETMKEMIKNTEVTVKTLTAKQKNQRQMTEDSFNDYADEDNENVTKINRAKKRKFKWFKCTKMFQDKALFQNHNQEHIQTVQCKMCDEPFSKMYDLEIHLQEYHDKKKELKCDQCDEEFITKLRMTIHKKGHLRKRKFCHFFNNGKICLFSVIGCKFEYKLAENVSLI